MRKSVELFKGTAVFGEAALAKAIAAEPTWAVVSIRGSKDRPFDLRSHTGPRIHLSFDDVRRADGTYVPPSLEDASLVVGFAQRLCVLGTNGLMVHCKAGISRSTATMIIMLSTMLGAGHEKEAVAGAVRAVKNAYGRGWREHGQMAPNPTLLWHGDTVLGRRGKLYAAYLEKFVPAPSRAAELQKTRIDAAV